MVLVSNEEVNLASGGLTLTYENAMLGFVLGTTLHLKEWNSKFNMLESDRQ